MMKKIKKKSNKVLELYNLEKEKNQYLEYEIEKISKKKEDIIEENSILSNISIKNVII